MQKVIQFKTKGMQMDLSSSAFNSEYAYENKNIRIMPTDESTLLSIVNEKGNKTVDIEGIGSYIKGIPIGQSVVNNELVIFTSGDKSLAYIPDINSIEQDINIVGEEIDIKLNPDLDYEDKIYKLWFNDEKLNGKRLFSGQLNFNEKFPIEAISVYENNEVKKVYWVDGINQPRVINLQRDYNNEDEFNFSTKISYSSKIDINKLDSGGSFPSGVIQYIFTYYNLHGQQSSPFYISPLYFISSKDRGIDAENKSGCAFKITMDSLDTSYEYVRIYSVVRTSIDATPSAYIVGDFPVNNNEIIYVDKGENNISIDPTELIFLENNTISVGTISQKDNTLFLGNINKLDKNIGTIEIGETNIKDYCRRLEIYTDYKGYYNSNLSDSVENKSSFDSPSFYGYKIDNNRNADKIRAFKFRETYRLGFIAQSYRGKNSEVIWINDVINDKKPVSDLNEYKTGIFKVDIPKELREVLIDNGFTKITPVIVYPSISDRTILCQGIVSPTVYNVEDRYTNSPFSQASWFFRFASSPLSNSTHGKSFINNTANYCEIQNIQDYSMYPYMSYKDNGSTEYKYMSNSEFSSFFKEDWFVDASIVTLNSPDIDSSDEIINESLEDIDFRIVGTAELISNRSDINVSTSTPGLDTKISQFVRYPVNYDSLSQAGANIRLSSRPLWYDKSSALKDNEVTNWEDYAFGFMVYPWHRNGSLNDQDNSLNNSQRVALLDKKQLSNLLYCITEYDDNVWEPDKGISTPVIFNSEEVTAIKLKPKYDDGFKSDLTYYGNIDRVLTPNLVNMSNKTLVLPSPINEIKGLDKSNGYPVCYGFQKYIGTDSDKINNENYNYYTPLNKLIEDEEFAPTYEYASTDIKSYGRDPIRMKYKSTPHAVILLNNYEYKDSIIPGYGVNFEGSHNPFWRDSNNWGIWSKKWVSSSGRIYLKRSGSSLQNLINGYWTKIDGYGSWKSITFNSDNVFSRVFEDGSVNSGTYTYTDTELTLKYKESDDYSSWDVTRVYNIVQLDSTLLVIDDTTITPIYSTKILIGELYRKKVYNRFGGTTDNAIENNIWTPCGKSITINKSEDVQTLSFTEGDCYFQRYDCLKTYPYTLEDQNSVVEILSTMIETRVNLDERVDRNRGQVSNLTMTPSNFNLFNNVYNQRNNLYTYRALNYSKNIINSYPNTITWSLSKTNGEDIDTWTHITLASTLELDGNKGELRAIRRFNNNLIAFQDMGISQILYNENMQISSTEGVPIEIANSGKVNGKRYLYNNIGCSNKWSLCETSNGIYFIDDITKGIFLFNGKLDNLSDRLGFHSWINSRSTGVNIWNPKDFNGFVTYYDKVNGDVFFISKDECLAFSEPLGQFTSFYSYEHLPYFTNLEDKGIAINTEYNDSLYKIWLHNEGDYNIYFGKYYPFYTTVIANPDMYKDKIFNNIEFRADSWNNANLLDSTFDTLSVWNEYQEGTATLNNIFGKPSQLKKKFRIWRANIPRDKSNNRDRMRNPWLYIKLSMEKENTNKTILHDIIVYYFE